ncbi:MAG: hypothetical protein CL920_16410 [Deltaproteobacteria bacterium]|nr:hypothetical protein [Deltaproteobacteria bacterium]
MQTGKEGFLQTLHEDTTTQSYFSEVQRLSQIKPTLPQKTLKKIQANTQTRANPPTKATSDSQIQKSELTRP